MLQNPGFKGDVILGLEFMIKHISGEEYTEKKAEYIYLSNYVNQFTFNLNDYLNQLNKKDNYTKTIIYQYVLSLTVLLNIKIG